MVHSSIAVAHGQRHCTSSAIRSGLAILIAVMLTSSSFADSWWSQTALGHPEGTEPINTGQQFELGSPFGVAVGPDGWLYATEITHHRVVKWNPYSGEIQIVAGTGERGYSGDDGPATQARLNEPYEARWDRHGNLYVVEMANHVVRRVRKADGVIETVAGNGTAGFAGDGGPAVKAQLNRPHSIEVDGDRLMIADIGNHRIRVVDLRSGRIDTLAGNGEKQLPTEGSVATGHPVAGPRALAIRGDELLVALREGHSVWKLSLKDLRWTHVAGTGEAGYSGDGGPAREARFRGPKGIAWASDGSIYISDTENHAIRRIDPQTRRIQTICGGGTSLSLAGRMATATQLGRPHGVAVDKAGRVYIADTLHHRIQLAVPRLRIGIIGLDTSHVVAFTQILNRPDKPAALIGASVVAAYPIGSADIESSVSRREGYTKRLRDEWKVDIMATIPQLVERVDAVLLETNDGRPHLAQAAPVIRKRLPLFIDKPIAGSLSDAVAIFMLAERYQTPVFSSSSLRFGAATQAVRNGKVGKVWMANTFSPCALEATHPDLYWYGIHGVESLFTVMGPGCQSVRRVQQPSAELVTGTWSGGRIGVFEGLRPPLARGYGGRAFGERGIAEVGTYDGYQPLLLHIIDFFRTHKAPVSARETLEIYAFMTAADASKQRGGAAVTLKEVMQTARQEAKQRLESLEQAN